MNQWSSDEEMRRFAAANAPASVPTGSVTPEQRQAAIDRARLTQAGSGFMQGVENLGAAAVDVATLPVRGVMGAVNTALRLPNALGANIPYIPESAFGGSSTSMTPYYDRVRASGRAFSPSIDMPSLPQPDVSKSEDAFNNMNVPEPAAPNGAPAAPAGSGGGFATTAPNTQGQDPISAYASQVPTSVYDKDIEFTHTLTRMLGMAGMPQAQNARDLNLKFQIARNDNVIEGAQRAFIAGDPTKMIDVFNHMIPNGQQITGYRANPDGTYAFQMQSGKVVTKSGDEVMQMLTMYRDPKVYGSVMTARAKALADMQRELAVANAKGRWSYEQALATHQLDAASKQQIENLKRLGEQPKFFQQVGGETFMSVQTPNGPKGYMWKLVQNQLTGKKERRWIEIDVPYGTIFGGAGGGADSGTIVDPNLIPIAPGLR